MPLVDVLNEFGPQLEGSRGQAWAILVERAVRYIERAQTPTDDADTSLSSLREAAQLLDLAIGDMKA